MGRAKKRRNRPESPTAAPLTPESPPPEELPTAGARSWRWPAGGWLLLLLVTALLYGHTLHAPWYLDDTLNILDKGSVRNLSQSLQRLLTPRGPAYLTFALNYALDGYHLAGFHLVNIAIHFLTSGLVFLIARRIFRRADAAALVTALIFLAHPLQTQAVTYIVQRMTSLAALFFFLGLYAFIRCRETAAGHPGRRAGWYLLALVAGALAVLTKQNTAVLPVALWLFEAFFLEPREPSGRRWQGRLVRILPFCLAPLAVAASQLLQPLSAGGDLHQIAGAPDITASPLQYLVTEFTVIWLYLRLLLVPYPQLLEYNYPTATHLLTLPQLLAGAGLLGLGVLAFALRRKAPKASFAIAWFFLGLAVESSVIPLDPVFEHRLYLPMFGFAVLVVALLQRLGRRRWLPAALVLLLVFGALTWRRNRQWNDDLAFYRDNLARAGASPGLVIALSKRLNEHRLYGEAEQLLVPWLARRPDLVDLYVNLSYAYIQQGRQTEAKQVLEQMLGQGLSNKLALYNLAYIYREQRDYQKALQVYRQALAAAPGDPKGLTNLAYTLRLLGRDREAAAAYRRALKAAPANLDALYNLGSIAYNDGHLEAAYGYLQRAVRYGPDTPEGWLALGVVARDLGQQEVARQALDRLNRLKPEMARVLAAELARTPAAAGSAGQP